MKKVLVWMSAVLLVVLACIVPCFADTWQEETPDYGLPLSGAPLWSNASNNTHKTIEIVEKATALGLFGGAQPVQIYYKYNADNTWFHVMVAVPATTSNGFYGGSISDTKPKNSYFIMQQAGSNTQYVMTNNVLPSPQPFVLYTLQFNGDWSVSDYKPASGLITTSNVPVGNQTTEMYKRVAAWSATLGDWVAPPVHNNNQDIVGWGVDTTPVPGLQAIIDKYDEQIALLEHEHIEAPPASYNLDIASILDSMFNGTRSIFEGFDINIFGISIVGILVAVLVITIVAFIVRKLWK